jgi:hypothetical protein
MIPLRIIFFTLVTALMWTGTAAAQPTEGAVETPSLAGDPLEVVGAYRPVDITTEHRGPLAQSGLDLYLHATPRAGLEAGQRFDVFRRVMTPTAQITLVLRVGEVQIVSVQPTLAVARVIGGPDVNAQPHLKTPGVMVGDYILPAEAKEAPAPPVKPRPRARKKKKKAPKAKAKAETDSKEKAPAKEARPDQDSFEFWEEKPIDF